MSGWEKFPLPIRFWPRALEAKATSNARLGSSFIVYQYSWGSVGPSPDFLEKSFNFLEPDPELSREITSFRTSTSTSTSASGFFYGGRRKRVPDADQFCSADVPGHQKSGAEEQAME